MSNQEKDQWVRAAQGGDEAAFEKLMAAIRRDVLTRCQGRINMMQPVDGAGISTDLEAEFGAIFDELLRIGMLRLPDDCLTYFDAATYCRSQVLLELFRRADFEPLGDDSLIPVYTASHNLEERNRVASLELARFLERLGHEFGTLNRNFFTMKYVDGYETQFIAQVSDYKRGKINSELKKARDLFQRTFGTWPYEDKKKQTKEGIAPC